MLRSFLFLVFALTTQSLFAQSPLKIIKATSRSVSINDGGFLDKNSWNLSPKARPDIYTAYRTRSTKYVTFYTDIDSIRVKLKPGRQYDFIILLNNKDSCYTRIESAMPKTLAAKGPATHDTIPFTLTNEEAIHVRSLVNDTDTLDLHFDISSFNFRLTKDFLQKNKGYKITKLQMGTLVWNNPTVGATDRTATGMDGRFGWNLFENKVVEIDYDHSILVIHSSLPQKPKGYNRSKLAFQRSYPCIYATISINGKNYSGYSLLDTGSGADIFLDSAWRSTQNFPTDLPLIKTITVHDARGTPYETKVVSSPLITLNGLQLTNIPTHLLPRGNPAGFTVNLLGNALLKRFNTLLDFKHDYVYLKPNHFTSTSLPAL